MTRRALRLMRRSGRASEHRSASGRAGRSMASLAVGDGPAFVAACCAERLGLRFHPSSAVNAANDKLRTRERFRRGRLERARFPHDRRRRCHGSDRYPCVLKPLHSSASRGVIRADTPAEFATALADAIPQRSRRGEESVLVEDFIPGREFALEGIVTDGRLQTLAIFDKPDPLDGPFFEETIYVTPSREPAEVQRAIRKPRSARSRRWAWHSARSMRKCA